MDEFDLGPLYSTIGEVAVRDARFDPPGLWMHVQAGDGWAGASLFQDLGDRIVYRAGGADLFELIRQAWDSAPEDKKWHSFTYEIIADRFEMKFFYADDFDPDDPDIDHRDRLLKARFGDKKVDYPDPEPGV